MDDAIRVNLLQLVKKNVLLLIVLTVAFGLGAYGLSYLLPDEYTSSTSMYVLRQDENGDTVHANQSEFTFASSIATDVVSIMKSERVAEEVSDQLGISSLESYHTDIVNESNSRLITLKVTGADAQMAADIADAIVADTTTIAVEAMNLKAINVIEGARTPTRPSGPNHVQIGVVGIVAGFSLACVIAFLRGALDTRIHSDEEIMSLTGLPVVGHFAALN